MPQPISARKRDREMLTTMPDIPSPHKQRLGVDKITGFPHRQVRELAYSSDPVSRIFINWANPCLEKMIPI